jgi:hypothetical protein
MVCNFAWLIQKTVFGHYLKECFNVGREVGHDFKNFVASSSLCFGGAFFSLLVCALGFTDLSSSFLCHQISFHRFGRSA